MLADLTFDRCWLLTWTTYGTWLPGDKRGFVAPYQDKQTQQIVLHNMPGTPYDADMPLLAAGAQQRMLGRPVYLAKTHAQEMIIQFHEAAFHRSWILLAASVMRDHAHLVVEVIGGPGPSKLLQDFKSYAGRRLNKKWGKPRSGTWWTESGSKRKLDNERAIIAGIRYVRKQKHPLAVWIRQGILDGQG